MGFKILKASDLQKQITVNMLVYGPPGVGKTTFASTAPKPLIIDLENGSLSLLGKNVDIAQVDTLADAREAVKYALNNGYQTVVIDSITRYAELLMDEILRENKRETARIQDWGEVVKRIKKLIWHLQAKNINTIFVALETEEKDEDSLVKRPAVPGQLKVAIPAIVDIVGYMRVLKDGSRVVSVKPTAKWYAKDRSGKLPDDITPDFSKILNLIRGENGGLVSSTPNSPTNSQSSNSSKTGQLEEKYIKGIHAWAGLTDWDYKAFIKEEFGKSSSKELTKEEALKVIEEAKKVWYNQLNEIGHNPVNALNKALAKITYKEAKEFTGKLLSGE
jgi:phage nucleotide-binding protein